MCCDKKSYTAIKYGSYGSVVIANGNKINAKGIGTVKILVGTIEKTVEISLSNVLYVPEIEINLMSVKKITD